MEKDQLKKELLETTDYHYCPLEDHCNNRGNEECGTCCMNPGACTQNFYECDLTEIFTDEDFDEFIVS